MMYFYQLPSYVANVSEIKVFNSDHKAIGLIQRFNENKVLEKIARHLSSKFVLNVRAFDAHSDTIYEARLDDQFKAFVTNVSWTLYKNKKKIGSIKEEPVGRILTMQVNDQRFRAKAEITNLREVTFSLLQDDEEVLIAKTIRNASVTKPFIQLTLENNHPPLSPLLFVLFGFIHHNQGK